MSKRTVFQIRLTEKEKIAFKVKCAKSKRLMSHVAKELINGYAGEY